MAQRKSLLEEIREQNGGANLNQGVVSSARKTYDDGRPSQQNTQQQGQRTSLLQEIIDSDGMGSLNKDYVDKALGFDGGFGALAGGYIPGDDGKVYMRDYKSEAEILRERLAQTAAEKSTGGVYAPEDMSKADSIVDRLLGVDRTQVTGEKTNWWDIVKGSFSKGLNQWNALNWKSMKFLFGDLAEDLHALGTETVNGVVDALNLIPGVNLKYIGQDNKNLIEWGYEDATAGLEQATEKYKANANSSRAAQIVDQFGTSTVAAIPMAIEAILLAPAQASAAGGAATTAGLQYFSGLQSAGGMEAVGMMARQGLTKLFQNPQFWTSYLQVAGDGYESALEEGMSEEDAGLYGLVNGFFNAMVEIGGADEALGGIQNLPMRLQEQGGKHAVVEWFKDAVLGEAKEEVIQGMMERGLLQGAQGDSLREMFSLDPTNTRAAFNPYTAAQEAIGGGVVGAVLGGGQTAINKAVTGGMNAAADAITTRQEQQEQAAQETGRQYVQQVITNMDVSETEQQILADGFQAGNADAQTYARGIQEAFRLGEMGLSFEQAIDNSTFGDQLNQTQFRHAWEIGARKAGHSTETVTQGARRSVSVPEYESIEEFSRDFKAPERVTAIFDQAADTDVNEFAAGFRAAYDMGQSGVSANYLTEANVPALTAQQAQEAYALGKEDAAALAQQRTQTVTGKQKTGGNQARVRGSVRGDGVSIADLKRTFNDSQNTAYRLLTRYADTTGVNIVLYNSQADQTTGLFPAAQGRFQWKDDTIYVDINSGLFSTNDVNGLGNYTMMRTFAHEFTHFIEKWNSSQYNEFREFVFQTMEARGQNVHDMIEAKQALDESGNMTYEQASREVVADAMMDILPDSSLVQQLANEHPNVFRTLLRKLREFAARMKQYYKGLRGRITEAETLKENGAYLDDIVQMWDNIAKGAVRNYQGANGEILVDQPAKPENLPRRTSRTQETSKSNPSPVQPETRRAGMDFFRPVETTEEAAPNLRQMAAQRNRPATMDFFREVEVTEEEAPKLAQMAAQRNQPVTRDRFPANDFTSQAEAAPDLKGMVPRAEEAPSEAQEAQAAEEEPETPAAAETPAAEETGASEARQDTPEGARLREALSGTDRAETIINGIRYYISYDNTDQFSGNRWYGEIRRTDGENYTGVVVQNARNLIYSGRYGTREAAVDELVAVAENNNLLKEAANESAETTAAETPDVRAETGDRNNGTGAVRVSPELQEEPVRGDAAEGNADTVPSEEGNGTGRHGDRPDAGRTGRIGSEGTGESGVQPGRSELTETPKEEPPKVKKKRQKKLKEAVEHDVEQKSTEKPGGNNFEIGDSLNLDNGSKTRYKTNVEAIRIVKLCEAENRNATPEEQAVLSKYVGWGGLSQAFDKRNSEWSKEYEELKALLTDEEYRAAAKSTQNAHYTSIEVIKAMYQGLQKLGYKGGMMLEPSCGTGNFVGAMPANMRSGLKGWTMVELDSLTSRIAKLLYPQSDVRNEGFQNSVIPNNSIDVAIGNVPFSEVGVYDRSYSKKLTSSLHNYFFVKTLDKVRPGGIVMFITSSGTMNAANAQFREYFAKQADLLGAIRLPDTAFKSNANTDVVTDILIMKKRAPGTEYAGEAFIESSWDGYLDTYVNEYYKAHPEMILGKETRNGKMYRGRSYTVEAYTDRGTLGEQIEKAFDSITGKMEYPAAPSQEKTNFKTQRENKKAKQGSYVQKEGKLYQHNGSTLKEVQTDAKTAKKISGMVAVRDWARALMDAQQQGASEDSVKALRDSLNKAYDDFVKENGYLNNAANRKAFADDPDKYSLFALEKNFKREKTTVKNKSGKEVTRYVETAEKADIFTENTIQPNRTVTHADTVAEGLIVSRNTTGGVDAALIAKLTGKSQDDVTRELIEGEMAFKNSDGNLEPAEVYLSGNVRAKLRDAKTRVGFDKDYQHNIDALQKVIPEDVPHEQIFVQVGSPWIPADVYADFAAYMLGSYNTDWRPAVKVVRSPETGQFKVQLLENRLKDNSNNKQVWGTKYHRKTFLDIFEATLNSKSLSVTMKDAEGKKYVDQVATAEVNDKVEKINKEFSKWLWQEKERTKDLEYLYNETFNAIVTPKYDGSTLTVNGLRAGYSLMEHQANAVQRVISSGGNTLLAHKVGAGKTMEMAAAAMKLKELGIINKPMFAVPKSLVAQWGKEFSNFFPTAKLLVAEEGDFKEANRKTFANRIATGNYDAIIVSYEQFAKIPISNSFAQGIYQEQIDDIVRSIEEAKEELGEKYSVKQMEKKKDSLQKKIDELSDIKKDENTIEFEQLGIDALFVDEAHNFKNLFYSSAMTNVAGLGNRDGAKRSFDLYTKTRYLQQLNGGRGIVFATATPVMNSMSEMYIMQKYLQPDLLKQLGLSSFDAWAKQFGEVVNAMEIKPSGQGYRVKQSFSRFKNLNELQMLFRGFSDVLTSIPGLKIPKMKGGSAQYIECEPGEFQQEYMKKLEERANKIKNVDPREDNMLKITSDGRKVSYTQRMIDPSLPYEEGCKVYRCADKVVEVYKESNDVLGTQIVFCDMATPKGKSNSEKAQAEEDSEIDTESAKLYDDMKARMVKGGIPANEIAFIHDAKTDEQKTELFEAMNEGKIRVLIGSTGKMGVGMNAQRRAYAIHHLDAPWRPGDVEQRNGRVFRQKNMNDEAYCFIYYTKKSFDSRLWDILKRKQGFIDQIMNGENIGREVEDTGEITISAAEIAALASDNPLIKEQFELEVDMKRLGNLQMAHNQAVFEARKKEQQLIQQKAETEQRIENGKNDLKTRKDEYGEDNFKAKIGSTTYTDRKKAGEAIYTEAYAKTKPNEGYTKIGTFAGFDILAMTNDVEARGMLRGAQGYTFPIYSAQKTLSITRMQEIPAQLEDYIKQRESKLGEIEKEIQTQEAIMSSPFEEQEELDRVRSRYNEVMDILNPKEEQTIGESEDDDNVEYSLRVRQEFSSAATSRPQVAKLFKSKVVEFEDTNIDIGGGKYNYTTDYLMEEFGTTNMVYDPYNRGSEENLAVIDWLRAGNRADTATCANVLNVIKEQEARRNVILEVAKSIKEDGTAYFSTWEDNRANQEKGAAQTGEDSWQNRRKTADYVHEVEEFFNDVVRRGDVIIAREPKAELPAAFWRVTEEEEIEYSTRRAPGLSNREVLSMAADELDSDSLSEAERNALQIFRDNLTRLEEEQDNRQRLGREYKDQQFTKGGSRQEADRIRAAMSVSDSKIKALENRLLSLENKEVLKGVLEKARRVVELEERKRGDENLKRYRERRNESMATRKYRERVRREVETLREWLMRPSNKDQRAHVPAEIQKTVADFIESINFMSKTALRTSGLETTKADERYLKNLRKMRDAIKANVDTQGYSGYADLPEGFVDTFNALITKAEQHIGDSSGVFVVNQMSAAELQQLAQTIRTLRKYIVTMNSFHNNAMFQHAYEAGEDTVQHLSKFQKSKKSGTAYKFMRFDYMRPSYAFEHFGKGGQSIEHEFREGQATQAFLANRIIDFAKKTYTGKEVEKWSKETKTFTTTDGETVTMPITHLMSLYCLNKRPQALTHIYGDGIRVANYKNGKQVELDEGHIVTIEDVQQMIQELTPRQREVADALQKYMSTETATWGNYVSLARFDVEQFTEENYFPINSDGRYLSTTADESPDNAGLYALLNSSFTKELKENADNRIILYNIFDVFANHTASMTQYRSFALPVLDALKWFNYKNDTTSVRTKLSSAFGAPLDERAGSGAKGYAEQFVINLLKAYNGTSAQGDPYDTLPLKMLHHFNGAAIAYNLRVIIQQPTAVTRAAMILSPAKLMKGLSMSAVQMRKLAEEMEQHSGIAAWKALGFYDTNISRGLTDLIKQNPGVMDRVMEVGTKGAEAADRFTWAAMWYAAKDSVKRSDYRTEEEYFKAVTDLFEEVIYKTQVVDSLLTKAEFLRSKGGIARQMGSFMSEPSATMSMLTDAYFKYTDDLQQGMGRSEAWKRNGGNIAKTAAVYAVGQVILSAMQAVIDAWRDQDDKDPDWLKNYLQKYLAAFKSNVVEEELIFGKIPLVSELYELMKNYLDKFGVFDKLGLDIYGNDTASGLAMYTKYLTKAVEIIAGKVTGDSKYQNYTNYGIVYNLIRAAANLSGVPFATAWREVQDLWNNTVGFFNPRMKLETYRRKVDQTYIDSIQQTGLAKASYEKILDEADKVHGDGNGSIKQDELGAALVAALEEGTITEEQAQAVWETKGWKKTFDGWRGLGSDAKTETPAASTAGTSTASKRVAFTPTAAPAATSAPATTGARSYDDFKKVPVYDSTAKQAMYGIWETQLQSSMSLDRFMEILTTADTDGNDSLKQDEMGVALMTSLQSGELTFDQCDAIWRTQWNKARSKTFAKWLNG